MNDYLRKLRPVARSYLSPGRVANRGVEHEQARPRPRTSSSRSFCKDSRVTAYVISEVEVLDESQGQSYRELASASIAQYDGRYIVRGATPEVPEGTWPDNQRVVIVEFPSMQDLQRWYRSPEYAEALALRRTALDRRLLFVEGVGGQQSRSIPVLPPSVE